MDGHAVQGGGIIVDSGKFDWTNGNFPDFTEPDVTYHGISYTETYGKAAYIIKARMQLMRDFGAYPAAHSAFLLNLGLETLALRMERYCENALKVAKYFEQSDKIESVTYPGLESDENHALAEKYLKGSSGVISIVIKGGRDNAVKFMDSLKLASNEVLISVHAYFILQVRHTDSFQMSSLYSQVSNLEWLDSLLDLKMLMILSKILSRHLLISDR